MENISATAQEPLVACPASISRRTNKYPEKKKYLSAVSRHVTRLTPNKNPTLNLDSRCIHDVTPLRVMQGWTEGGKKGYLYLLIY